MTEILYIVQNYVKCFEFSGPMLTNNRQKSTYSVFYKLLMIHLLLIIHMVDNDTGSFFLVRSCIFVVSLADVL